MTRGTGSSGFMSLAIRHLSPFGSRSHSRPAPDFYSGLVRLQPPSAPPFLPGRLTVGQRPFKAHVLVQVQPRQPILSPDCERESCLSYKEMLRVQFLLGRPIFKCLVA